MRERGRPFAGRAIETALEERERFGRRIGEIEESEILAIDHAMTDERLEVDDLAPVARAIKQHGDRLLDLACLHESEDLHELIERAEAAREHDERARQMREPELAHEKVMELEQQRVRDIGIRTLLVRQADVEPNRLTRGIRGASIRGLHDAPAPARANHVAALVRRQRFRPQGQQARKLACITVVRPQRPGFAEPCRAEEHDGVANTRTSEPLERLQVLGEDGQRASAVAREEAFVLIGERRRVPVALHARNLAKSMKPRSTSRPVSSTLTRSPTRTPSKPRMSRPSVVGLAMRTQVPFAAAPVTIASNGSPMRPVSRSAAADFATLRSTLAAPSSCAVQCAASRPSCASP